MRTFQHQVRAKRPCVCRAFDRQFKIRRATDVDYSDVGAICAETFSNSLPELAEWAAGWGRGGQVCAHWLEQQELLRRHRDEFALVHRLAAMQRRKREAQLEQRAFDAEIRNLAIRAQLALVARQLPAYDALSGEIADGMAVRRRNLVRWRYAREGMVLVATTTPSTTSASAPPATAEGTECVSGNGTPGDASGVAGGGPGSGEAGGSPGQVAGCCVVTLKVLGALLPPPFPTRLPARLYVGNIAVRRPFRRQGMATSLLVEVERLARRWRHSKIWLHVQQDNHAALTMYKKLGYSITERDREPRFPFSPRYLMCKDLQRAASRGDRLQSTSPGENGSRTYSWDQRLM